MIYPARYMIHRDHETGDRLAGRDATWTLPEVSPADFVPARFTKPIGGVQICPGSFCRLHGYLDGSRRHQKPLAKPFGNFHDDVAFRKFCAAHGQIRPVDFPGLFRLRHTRTSYKA
jgi:hypothetical protein